MQSKCIILSIVYWIYRLSRAIYNLLSYFNIRAFYAQALDIKPVMNATRRDATSTKQSKVFPSLDSFEDRSTEHDLA